MSHRLKLLLAATLFAFMTSAASGTVIISNTPGTSVTGDGAIVGGVTRSFAQGFTMGSSDYLLDSVTMGLRVNAAGRAFNLELFSGSPNPGGSSLVSFTVPVLNTTGDALYTFNPDSAITLQANTTYWLVAYSLTTGSLNQIQWLRSNPGVAPTGIATYAGARFDSPATVPPTNSITLDSIFEVNGTLSSVPEPGAGATTLAALAIVLSAVRARRAPRR